MDPGAQQQGEEEEEIPPLIAPHNHQEPTAPGHPRPDCFLCAWGWQDYEGDIDRGVVMDYLMVVEDSIE